MALSVPSGRGATCTQSTVVGVNAKHVHNPAIGSVTDGLQIERRGKVIDGLG